MRIILALSLAGCVGSASGSVDGGSDADPSVAFGASQIAVEDDSDRGGYLPPGYYQRQCQFDACGGPLSPLRNVGVDPGDR